MTCFCSDFCAVRAFPQAGSVSLGREEGKQDKEAPALAQIPGSLSECPALTLAAPVSRGRRWFVPWELCLPAGEVLEAAVLG